MSDKTTRVRSRPGYRSDTWETRMSEGVTMTSLPTVRVRVTVTAIGDDT